MQSKPAFQLFIALVSLITFTCQLHAQTDSLRTIADSAVTSDSIPRDSIPSDTIQRRPEHISKDAIQSKISYTAVDTIKYNFAESKVYLYGDAVIKYEDVELKAAYIELRMDSDIVFAQGVPDSNGKIYGSPIFKDGDQEFRSQKMMYNFRTEKGKIDDVITQEGEGYIHGEDVKKTEDDIVYIHNGLYTTCDHDHPHFSIAAKRLKIIPDDKIIAKPANLIIEDVPTPIIVPFGIFPNRKRGKSGILMPVPGESEQDGFYIWNVGYYIYINERTELQLEGDIYSKGSYAFRPIFNYKTRYKRSGSLKMRYKHTVNGIIEEDPNYSVTKDFWIDWNHRQDPKARPNSSFSGNVSMGSVTSYRNDINTADEDYLKSNFQSKISYSKYMLQKKLNFSLNARHSQNNNDSIVNLTLPEASLTLSRIYPFKSKNSAKEQWWHKIGLSYTGNFRNELKIKAKEFNAENFDQIRDTMRNGIAHVIPISTNFKVLKYFSLNPTFNYRENWYFSTIEQFSDTVTDTNNITRNVTRRNEIAGFSRTNSYNFSANLTTKIYGMVQFRKGAIKAIRHIVTPSVGLAFNPENNQGQRSYTRIPVNEDDTIPEVVTYSIYDGGVYGNLSSAYSGRITLGLLNNIEMKVKNKTDSTDEDEKIKILENLRFNTSYDMVKDSLKWSAISMSGFTNLTKRINLRFDGNYDLYSLDTTSVITDDGERRDEVFKVNKYEWDANRRLARMTRASLALNFKFTSNKGVKKKKDDDDGYFGTDGLDGEEEDEFDGTNLDDNGIRRDYMGVDWDVPWNLGVNYSVTYSKPEFTATINQSLKATGDLSITKNWKFQFETWFDFREKEVSYARVGILRNLHCWEMKMDWVPIGPRQNYNFYIGVRANLLQDLKLEKKDF